MKGVFKPIHPEKYNGDVKNIIYRSSYEFKFFRYLDSHPEIETWASEELHIPYVSPVDNRLHKYYPDVLFKTNKGEIFMIEIKPAKECQPPVQTKGKQRKTFINEAKTYGVNQAKWSAAMRFCVDRGWMFRVLTEKELGIP